MYIPQVIETGSFKSPKHSPHPYSMHVDANGQPQKTSVGAVSLTNTYGHSRSMPQYSASAGWGFYINNRKYRYIVKKVSGLSKYTRYLYF